MRPAAESGPPPDVGSVTAELALALPTVLLVLAVCLHALLAAALAARAQDAARIGARAVARGEPDAVVRRQVAAGLPAGSLVHVQRLPGESAAGGDAEPLAVVEVAVPWPAPDVLRFAVGDGTVHARASTPDETGSFAVVAGAPDG